MNASTVLLLLLASTGQQGGENALSDRTAKAKSRQLLELHTADAASYSIFRDAARTQKLTLKREPVYRWTNPTRSNGQEGEVYVWTYRGRPEVIGSIFSHPTSESRRTVCHELQSLSLAVLVVDRTAAEQWVPQAPGVDLKPVEGAPKPAGDPGLRLTQIRAMAREFTGRSLSNQGKAWELRLLPRPLHRYESTDPDVVDGALFALVSSAGTDPELVLVLEARVGQSGPQWLFGAARFSDMNLWLSHNNNEVWSAIRSDEDTQNHDAKHRYRFFQDRRIPELNGVGSKPEVQ